MPLKYELKSDIQNFIMQNFQKELKIITAIFPHSQAKAGWGWLAGNAATVALRMIYREWLGRGMVDILSATVATLVVRLQLCLS